MAKTTEVLRSLEHSSRSCPLKVRELAEALKANPGSVSVQLHRLSREGFIAKSGQKGGWYITRQGKKRLEMLARPAMVAGSPQEEASTTMIASLSGEEALRRKWTAELDESIESAQGTDYGVFLELGKQLEVEPNLVMLTTETVWRAGDYRDPMVVWTVLSEMVIEFVQRKRWFYCWFGFLGKHVPQEVREQIEICRC